MFLSCYNKNFIFTYIHYTKKLIFYTIINIFVHTYINITIVCNYTSDQRKSYADGDTVKFI